MTSPSLSQPHAGLLTAKQVHEALKRWQDPAPNPLHGLFVFRNAVTRAMAPLDAQHHVLGAALDALAAEDANAARLLRLRFEQQLAAEDVGRQLHLAPSTVFRQQREATQRLAEIIGWQEQQARRARRATIDQRLHDRTYSTLIGVDDQITQLAALLHTAQAPFVLAIEGMGGLGKTALADAVARRFADDETAFVDLAWVTARQQTFNLGGAIKVERDRGIDAGEVISLLFRQLWQDAPAPVALSVEHKLALMRQRLSQAAHLVVIDNLETIADLENLLPAVRQLAGPSKFLLTSRQSLYGEPGVYHHQLRDLIRMHALQLLRQEAAEHNVAQILSASDDELQPIYDTVGGNPLALRLVAGLVRIHPLRHVLGSLKQAHGLPVLNLYSYIYHRAWDNLDAMTRQVFLAMPLVLDGRGGDLELITATCGLPEDVVSQALGDLMIRNLVDAHGGLNERSYTIHSLTRTFLHEVARWK